MSIPVRKAYHGSPVNHSILLDDLLCNGTEGNLLNCPTYSPSNIGDTDCTHSEDAGVRCEGKLHIALLILCYYYYLCE